MCLTLYAGYSQPMQAQSYPDFYPAPQYTDSVFSSPVKIVIRRNLVNDINNISIDDRQVAADLRQEFQNRAESVENLFERGLVIRHDAIEAMLNDQLERFSALADDELKDEAELKIFLSRFTSPNAFSTGTGFMFFNIGLIDLLENEAQVAFVTSHEIAHELLKHSNLRVINRVMMEHDPAFRRSMRQAMRQRYGRNAALMELMMQQTFSSSQHSRFRETEADSLALVLYLQAGYPFEDAVRTLEVLDSIEILQPGLLDLRNIFHRENFPFRNSWLFYQESELTQLARELREEFPDSLRTHPECQARIEALRLMKDEIDEHTPMQGLDHHKYTLFQRDARLEMVSMAFDHKQFARTLYLALIYLEHYPDEPFLHSMVARSLESVYQYAEKRRISEVVPFVSPRYPDAFNRVIAFLHELRLRDLKSIGYYFLEPFADQFGHNEHFIHSILTCARTAELDEEAEIWRARYEELYPDGIYADSSDD